MARFFGQRSKYLFRMAVIDTAASIAFLLALLWIIYLVIHTNGIKLFNPIYFTVAVIIFAPLFLLAYYLFKKADSESKGYLQGLFGEDDIAVSLKELSDQYSVYADVKIKPKTGNIDYVVIGPTGLFTIEVKSHRGIISFNGLELARKNGKLEKDFLKQAMSEAISLHDYLRERLETEIFIKPVVVFSSFAKMNFGLKPINNVFVVQKKWLNKLIESQMVSNFLVDRELIEKELKTLVFEKK